MRAAWPFVMSSSEATAGQSICEVISLRGMDKSVMEREGKRTKERGCSREGCMRQMVGGKEREREREEIRAWELGNWDIGTLGCWGTGVLERLRKGSGRWERYWFVIKLFEDGVKEFG